MTHTAPMQSSGEGEGMPCHPSLLPFSPPSLCLAASYSLRQVTVHREALDVGSELSRGAHGWGCTASTQNWPIKQNGRIALFFVNEDEEDRLEQKCLMRAAGPTLQRTGRSRQAPVTKAGTQADLTHEDLLVFRCLELDLPEFLTCSLPGIHSPGV